LSELLKESNYINDDENAKELIIRNPEKGANIKFDNVCFH